MTNVRLHQASDGGLFEPSCLAPLPANMIVKATVYRTSEFDRVSVNLADGRSLRVSADCVVGR